MNKALARAMALIVVVLLIGSAIKLGLFGFTDHARVVAAIARVRGYPLLKPAFVIVYALAASVGVPASPLTLAGGALFGAAWGIALNWLGCVSAALLAFGLTRALKSPAPLKANAEVRVVTGKGFGTLFRLRLVPIVPFALLNIGSAMSGMRWRTFALATATGVIPITVIYTVFAASLLSGVAGSGRRALVVASGTGALIIAASFVPAIVRRYR